jgi:hypothetical protein
MRTMLLPLAICCAAALAVAADAGSSGAARNPAACGPTAVARVISGFFDAYNRGDARAAVKIMDPLAGPRNQRPRGWYSIDETDSSGPGRHHAFYRRRPLINYFERRHRHHERMRLLTVLVGSAGGRADIQFRVHRDADDLDAIGVERNRVAIGKGALTCSRRKIFVWSMVHPDERVSGPVCPGGAVACSRRR